MGEQEKMYLMWRRSRREVPPELKIEDEDGCFVGSGSSSKEWWRVLVMLPRRAIYNRMEELMSRDGAGVRQPIHTVTRSLHILMYYA